MWNDRSVKPKRNDKLLAYCPDWSNLGYQTCEYVNGKFYYDEQPNDMFDECVVQWSVINEV